MEQLENNTSACSWQQIIFVPERFLKGEGYTIEKKHDSTMYYNISILFKNGIRFNIFIPDEKIDKFNIKTIFGYKVLEQETNSDDDVAYTGRIYRHLGNVLDSHNVSHHYR